MAYVSKEKKAKVYAKLKEIIPRSWRWSLAVSHNMALVLTIAKAPVDLLSEARPDGHPSRDTYVNLNEYRLDKIKNTEIREIFLAVREAMNTENFNHSDTMRDYHSLGHYIDINIGKWDKPFELIAA